MWYRLQEILFIWYEQIQEEALNSAVLHADETGWRTDGTTNWLWCFGNDQLTYYMIDKSRGSPALEKVFHQRVFRNADHRLLGSVQRSCLCCATKMFGAFASRVRKYREIQRRSRRLGRVCEETSSFNWRCDSVVATEKANCRRRRMRLVATDCTNDWMR